MQIEHNVPVSGIRRVQQQQPNSLRKAVSQLKPVKIVGEVLQGDSFQYHNGKSPMATAHQLGVKVIVRREEDHFRVWRRA